DLELERDELALFIPGSRAHRHHLALLRLLLGGIGNDDAAAGFLLRVDALDDDAIVQRTELHEASSRLMSKSRAGQATRAHGRSRSGTCPVKTAAKIF